MASRCSTPTYNVRERQTTSREVSESTAAAESATLRDDVISREREVKDQQEALRSGPGGETYRAATVAILAAEGLLATTASLTARA